MTDYKYIAKFEYGKPNLSREVVLSETEKQFRFDRSKHEDLVGWQWIGKTTNKQDAHIFDDAKDAIRYLLTECEKEIAKLSEEKADVENRAAELAKALAQLSEGAKP